MSVSPSSPLGGHEERLVQALDASLATNAFNNRYMLHPRQLGELAREMGRGFIDYLGTPAVEKGVSYGDRLSREGVGEKTLVDLVATLNRFCRLELDHPNQESVESMLETVDQYASSLFEGYLASREVQILSDQEQLRRALTTALDSQSRELVVKNHAIDTSINGIMLASLDGKVTYVNPSFLSLAGYLGADEVLGMDIGEFWLGEEGKRIFDGLPRVGGWSGELSARRRDGELLTVSLAASLIKNDKGEAIGIMSSFVDVTERNRLETQMQQVQKMDDLGQLAGGIAHDFNNLLTAIGGYLQLLLLEARTGTQAHQDLMQIKAAVDRGSGLTKQLRYFTRQATGKRQIVNLNDVALETYELLKHTFPPEIAVRIDLASTPWTIEADPNQMSQVLMNLCVNAREAIVERTAAAGGLTGSVTIETANIELTDVQARRYVNVTAGRYVRLRISDTGVGMPPELVQRLFVPFVTTKSAKSGTGLGLAVVYGIVRSHRGFIDVASILGRGSTFLVYLPTAERADDVMPVGEVTPTLAPGEGTILVVDDEAQVRAVLKRALERSGYTILQATNGKEALELYRQRQAEIDLVVLDMVMPVMGGRETLSRLRDVNPDVKVILITGYTADGLAHELVGRGAAGLVEKPIDLKQLTERVAEVLRPE